MIQGTTLYSGYAGIITTPTVTWAGGNMWVRPDVIAQCTTNSSSLTVESPVCVCECVCVCIDV